MVKNLVICSSAFELLRCNALRLLQEPSEGESVVEEGETPLTVASWVFIGIGLILGPVGVIILGLYLERKFGIPKK